MSNQLPNGWITPTISDIASIIRGVTYKKTESSDIETEGLLPVLRANNIQSGKLIFGDLVYVPEKNISLEQKIKAGDIVVAMSSGSKNIVGKTAHATINWEGGFGAFCGVLRPSKLTADDFLYFFTQSLEYRNQVSELSAGVNINNLKPSHFDEINIPLPPLAEQKEIATLLDNLLAQVDTLKTRLDAIPNILKRFRQSVLAAAVSGKLTEKNIEHVEISFGELITEMRNGLSPQPNDDKRGYPILRISAVRSLEVDKNDHRFLECDEKIFSTYVLENNDLLFTRYNGSLDFVGVCGIYRGNSNDKILYPDKLIRVRTNQNKLIPQYAEIFFSSPQTRKVVTDFVKSTSGQKGISGKDLKSVLVNLPSFEEQKEIVRRVEELFAFADQIEQRVKSAQQRVNHLTQAILAKAFRGELTAEWREQNPDLISGENSAVALLAQIKADRKK